MVIFHSYVSLLEGKPITTHQTRTLLRLPRHPPPPHHSPKPTPTPNILDMLQNETPRQGVYQRASVFMIWNVLRVSWLYNLSVREQKLLFHTWYTIVHLLQCWASKCQQPPICHGKSGECSGHWRSSLRMAKQDNSLHKNQQAPLFR